MESYSVSLARVSTSRFGFSKLGFRFEALFYCFIHSISSTFYSKSSCLIIPHKSFEKHVRLLDFFQHEFQTSRFGVSELGFRFEELFQCFIHSVSSTFYSKSSCLSIPHKSFLKHGQLLRFYSTCFKQPSLGFPNQGFDFKHFFTALYTLFLRHSILNHHA